MGSGYVQNLNVPHLRRWGTITNRVPSASALG
jgi:hypothetical protein